MESSDQEPVLTGKNIGFRELTVERANEIQKLTDAIENPNRTKMVYQRLPRHMQRRAMSHDPKRLPARARQAFSEQRDVTQLKVSKRPSRRHRRRPGNLLSEYNRRQRHHLWLETHIWHARRFHMVQRWGFKLPESATDKGFRAGYRASAHHCLIQDMSYLRQLELCGPETVLLSALSALGGSSAGSARLLSGRHQGRLLLTAAAPPHRPLAPASLLWQPADGGRLRRLWLWLHPAGYEAARDALIAALGLPTEPQERPVEVATLGEATRPAAAQPLSHDGTRTSGSARDVDQLKLAPRRLHVVRRWTLDTAESDQSLQLTELSDALLRFRLSGPGSQAALQACLRVAATAPSWERPGRLEAQRQLWTTLGALGSPAELAAGCVVALTVADPRQHLPRQRRLAAQRSPDATEEPVTELPAGAEASPLWDESSRRLVTTTKVSDNELNRARGHLLVPSATADALRLPPVPVLLLQNSRWPGWDLLLPAGWGMTFWVALQYHGARAGGLRETERMALETGRLRFPAEYPDSAAGRQWEAEQRDSRRQQYFRRPPDKRPNYTRLGVPDPFSCGWTRLLEQLCPTVPTAAGGHWPTVCRDTRLLRQLATALAAGGGRPAALPESYAQLLVAVRVRPTGRGVPQPGALLCLPQPDDSPTAADPVEPPAGDPAAPQRAKLRAAWLRRQATEKRRRQRCRRRQQPERAEQAAQTLSEQRKQQAAEMERLSLPIGDRQPQRQVIGHVTSGDFCLSEAAGLGTGFILMAGMLRLLDGGGGQLLFRNIDSDTYRWCRLTLVDEFC